MMASRAKCYSKIHIGLIENVLGELALDNQKLDYVVAYGVFLYQNPAAFEKTLGLYFKTAKKVHNSYGGGRERRIERGDEHYYVA